MPDDVVMQKLASIDRCLRAVRDDVAGDLGRLEEPIVLDAVVLNLQRTCAQAIDAACREVSRLGLGVPADSADAFAILERERLLTPSLTERMRRMVGFCTWRCMSIGGCIRRSRGRSSQHRLGDFEALCRELAAER